MRGISKQFKQLMRVYVEELAVAAGAENPAELAEELALLLEGAIVTAQVSKNPNSAKTAKKIAKMLIENAATSEG